MKIFRLLSMLLSLLPFSACAQGDAKPRAGALLVDARTPAEFNAEHAKGALLLPHDLVRERAEKLLPDKSAPIDLYCRSGRRSGLAMQTLREMGYTDVRNLGGLEAVKKAGVETETGTPAR